MIKILIAGKNSYIGKHLKNHFVNKCRGFLVNSISVRTDAWKSINLSIYDYVFFLAGAKPEHPDGGSEELNYYLNCHLPFDFAEAAKAAGISNFIFFSTIDVYGKLPTLGKDYTIDKSTPVNPVGIYGRSKLEGENRLRALESDNFHVTILRMPLVYGQGCPGMYQELLEMAKEHSSFPLIKNEISAINISTFCAFIQYLLNNNYSGTFHPQNKHYISTVELLELISGENLLPLHLSKGLGFKYKFLKNSCPQEYSRLFGSLTYAKDIDL